MVIWLYAFTSVLVISLCGLVPIICMPRLQRSKYHNDLLQFLIGLAIGTLTADALLHLLPMSVHYKHNNDDINNRNNITNGQNLSINADQPVHGYEHNDHMFAHDSHDHAQHENLNQTSDHHIHSSEGFWFGFMALIGIIGFLLLERIMVLMTEVFKHEEPSSSLPTTKPDAPETKYSSVPMSDHQLHHHQNHHQHQHHHLNSKTQSFMFMIITGDGLHNFFDGIAIGVSYGSSFAVGFSTSIAILCHELPHEIGDFAVLIQSGMSIKRAVLYNTLSSILCLFGAMTGVFIGKIDVSWVSALIAGMFLYISLVDMVPQLDCYAGQPLTSRAKKLFVQFSGITTGIGIMSLIAIYENKLHSILAL